MLSMLKKLKLEGVLSALNLDEYTQKMLLDSDWVLECFFLFLVFAFVGPGSLHKLV